MLFVFRDSQTPRPGVLVGNQENVESKIVLEMLSRSLEDHPDPIDSGDSAKTEILKKKEVRKRLLLTFTLQTSGFGEELATL